MTVRAKYSAFAIVGVSATGALLPRIPAEISLPAAVGMGLVAVYLGFRRALAPAGAFVALIGLTLLGVMVLPYLMSVAAVPVAVRYLLAIGIVGLGVGMRPQGFQVTTKHALIVAFLAFQLIPLMLADDPAFALLRLANWAMFVPLAFIVWRPRWLGTVTVYALATGLVLVLGAALQILGAVGGVWGGIAVGPDSPGLLAERAPRLTSFLQNPNDLGLAMVVLLTLALALSIRQPGSGRARTAAIVLAVVFGAVLISTSSRGAILAMPVVIAFTVLAGRGDMRSGVVVIGVTLAALVLGLVAFSGARTGVSSIYDLLSGQDQGALVRLDVWGQRLETTGVPLLGTGYGAFIGTGPGPFDLANRQAIYALTTVDNGWLKLIFEEGVVGTSLFALVLLTALMRAWRLAREPNTRSLGIVLGGSLLAISLRALSADIFDINPWNMVIWLVVGLSFFSDADGPVPRGQRSAR